MTAIGTATGTVQTAFYTRLTGDATLMAILKGVFDASSVPQPQIFPFVTIGETYESPMDCMGTVNARGYDGIYTLHGWSQTRGFKQLQSILGSLTRLLHRQSLVLSAQVHVGTWFDTANFVQDPDGISQHLVARYHLFSQENL